MNDATRTSVAYALLTGQIASLQSGLDTQIRTFLQTQAVQQTIIASMIESSGPILSLDSVGVKVLRPTTAFGDLNIQMMLDVPVDYSLYGIEGNRRLTVNVPVVFGIR